MNKYVQLNATEVKDLTAAAQKSIEVKTYKDKEDPKKILDFVGIALKAGSTDRPNAKYDEVYYCHLPIAKLSAVKPNKFEKHYAKEDNKVLLLFGHDKEARAKAKKDLEKRIKTEGIKPKKAKKLLESLPQGYDYDYFELYFTSKSGEVVVLDTLVRGKVNYDTYYEDVDGNNEERRRRYLNPVNVFNGKEEVSLGKTKDIKELVKLSDSIIARFVD